MNILDEIVIIIIKTIQHVGAEFLISKRLTNRGQCVRKTRHLVKVLGDRETIKFSLPQLGAYGMSTRRRL